MRPPTRRKSPPDPTTRASSKRAGRPAMGVTMPLMTSTTSPPARATSTPVLFRPLPLATATRFPPREVTMGSMRGVDKKPKALSLHKPPLAWVPGQLKLSSVGLKISTVATTTPPTGWVRPPTMATRPSPRVTAPGSARACAMRATTRDRPNTGSKRSMESRVEPFSPYPPMSRSDPSRSGTVAAPPRASSSPP